LEVESWELTRSPSWPPANRLADAGSLTRRLLFWRDAPVERRGTILALPSARKELAMDSAFRGYQDTSRPLRSVVAVSGDPQRAELMDALLADAALRDMVFVESIAQGYSRIKALEPDVVVVLLSDDHAPACQLLSMLQLDHDTSGIPVVTWMTRHDMTEADDLLAQITQDWSSQPVAIQMN